MAILFKYTKKHLLIYKLSTLYIVMFIALKSELNAHNYAKGRVTPFQYI